MLEDNITRKILNLTYAWKGQIWKNMFDEKKKHRKKVRMGSHYVDLSLEMTITAQPEELKDK